MTAILCGQCTLIYPNSDQRKPIYSDEQCEVCGKSGTREDHDGQTITIGPVTVGEVMPKGRPESKPPISKLLWIGVDLDGTLAEPIWTPENPTWEIGDPIWSNVEKLKEAVAQGFKPIIHTSRPWTDYQNIEHWLKHYGIPFKEIQCGKPLYAAYIDDRAIFADDESWLPR